MWFTSMSGIFSPIASDFANEVPTSNDPINPGPLVKAIAESSSLVIPAFLSA